MRARRTGRAPPGARGALAWPILGPPPRAPGERRPRRRRCATTELANFAAANLGANRPPWSVVHSSLDAHSCRSAPTTRSPVPWSLVDLFCQPHTYTHTHLHTHSLSKISLQSAIFLHLKRPPRVLFLLRDLHVLKAIPYFPHCDSLRRHLLISNLICDCLFSYQAIRATQATQSIVFSLF